MSSDVAPAPAHDLTARARRIADALLYEGYVLYPYRADATKNRLRFQWGVVAPPATTDTGERDRLRTQMVVEPGPSGVALVTIRHLRLRSRTIERCAPDGTRTPVSELDVDGTLHTTWDEGVECEVDIGAVVLDRPVGGHVHRATRHDETHTVEHLVSRDGRELGRVVRHTPALDLEVSARAEEVPGPYGLVRLTVEIANRTDWSSTDAHRDEVVRHAAVAAHALVVVPGGRLLSPTDPPEFAAPVMADCRHEGWWPVIVGSDPGRDDVALASPIILEDHPELAPESPGDWFDATEIDELLSLRVRTLTDAEKRTARATDPRAAAVVDMADDLPDEWLDRLHGAMRDVRGTDDPVDDPGGGCVQVGDVEIRRGSRVTLHPTRRADAHDLFLVGAAATVTGVFVDADDEVHVAVVVDGDPAAELAEWYGRYLYFRPDEVRPA